MNSHHTPQFLTTLRSSGRFALQWRLLVLWIITLLIPAALMTLPFWQIFAAQLNHSVYADALSHSLTMNAFGDLMSAVMINKMMVQQTGIGALVLTILLAPFLNGAVVTAARARETLTMGKLVHGGIAEYWRMVRLFLMALIPLGIAGGIGAGALRCADKYAQKAILESNADLASYAAIALLIILLVVADATADAGRAQFAHSTTRRSAIKAWWAGLKMIVRRPVATLGFYVVFTVCGAVLAGVIGVLRLNIGHTGVPGFILGLVLAQLMAACICWMRIARLSAFVSAGKTMA